MIIDILDETLDFTLITCVCNDEIHYWTIKDVLKLIQKVQDREKANDYCCDGLKKCGFTSAWDVASHGDERE